MVLPFMKYEVSGQVLRGGVLAALGLHTHLLILLVPSSTEIKFPTCFQGQISS